MDKNLSGITIDFLKNCSFTELNDIILELDNINNASELYTSTCEDIETYYEFSNVIFRRISQEDFVEFRGKKGKNKKNELTLKLLELNNRFLAFISFLKNSTAIYNAIASSVSKMNDLYLQTRTEINNSLENQKSEIENTKNKVNSVLNKIRDSEHEILTHVLTLMGIFVGIITIIMSVVITSTSWLNNSSSASAIIAFIVPNAVVILSIAVLFLFIFLYRKDIPYISAIQYSEKDMSEYKDVKEEQETDEKDKNKEKQKVKIKIRGKCKNEKNIQKRENRKRMAIFIGVIILVAASITVLTYSALKYIMPSENSHQRYIIKQSQYSVTDGYDYEANCKRQYFEFNNEGKNHQFAFNEKFIHDGNLYYCDDHNRLE